MKTFYPDCLPLCARPHVWLNSTSVSLPRCQGGFGTVWKDSIHQNHLGRSTEAEVHYPRVNLFKDKSQSLSTKEVNADRCRPMPGKHDRAEKRLRMRAVDSFWRIFDRLINERLAPWRHTRYHFWQDGTWRILRTIQFNKKSLTYGTYFEGMLAV